MHNFSIDVEAISPHIGAIISGVDLSTDLDDRVIQDIRYALNQHQVVFFKRQKLAPVQHLAFAARFGEIEQPHPVFGQHAAKAGIKIEPKRMPTDGYWSDVWMQHAWSASYWSGRPTEDWMFSQGYSDTSNWNETYWKHPRFNELLIAARAELDEAKRREMYGEMQLLVRDEGGAVIPLFSNYVMAHSDKLQAPSQVAGNWSTDGYKMVERWSFA